MGIQDQESEFLDWYGQSEQYQTDQALFNDWQTRVNNGEQLGVHFDQSYQDRVNAAAARLNYSQQNKDTNVQTTSDNNDSSDLAGNLLYQIYGDSAVVFDDDGNGYVRFNGKDYYTSSVTKGDWLYRKYGDSAVVFDDDGNGYVSFDGKDYYTSSVIKGDWLYRKYGDSVIVRGDDGIAYARFEEKDWYVSSLPQKDVSTQQTANGKAYNLTVNLNNASLLHTANLSNNVDAILGRPPETENSNTFTIDYSFFSDIKQSFAENWHYNFQRLLAPNDPAFIDATLNDLDIAFGYRLDYNPNGVLWRVNAAKRVHPDDLEKFYRQQEFIQSGADNLSTKFSMGMGRPILDKASQAESVLIQDSRQTTKEIGNVGKNITEILKNNKIKGDAYEKQVFEKANQTLSNPRQQVTIQTESGVRTRLDILGIDKETGRIRLIEAKSSPTAPLTKNQKAAFPEIEETGATVLGKGKDPYVGGIEIPPTKVEIIRPQDDWWWRD